MAYGNEKAISQASAKGKVKWFNATKGYGFITLDNGGDAFCHASALQATGHSDVPPGTTVVCDLADSQRGLQVVSVHSVDISTAEALKKTLLAAKSIAYSEPSAGGASGVYFAKLLERMGIAEQMQPKTKYPPPGGFSANLLMTGEAELAVQQKPELLHVAGAEVIGLLPGDLNVITEFAAAIMTDCKNGEAGKALVKMLQSPGAIAVFRSKGLDTP